MVLINFLLLPSRTSRLLPFFSITFLLTSPSLYAAPLTLPEAIQEASLRNADLAAAQATVAAAQAAVGSARSDFFPTISGDLDVTRSRGTTEQYSASVRGSQSLFEGFGTYYSTRRQRAILEATRATLALTKADVVADTKIAFARMLFAQEFIGLTTRISERRKDNLRLVELRYNAGRENRGAFLRNRALWKSAEFDVAQAKRALRAAQREIAVALGRDAFDVLTVTGTFTTPATPNALGDLRQVAMETPEVRRAQASLESDRAAVGVTRSGWWPSLSGSAAAFRQGPDFFPNQSSGWTASASLSYTIFSGWRTVYDVAGAKANVTEGTELLRSTLLTKTFALENSLAAFENASERIGVQESFVEAGEMRAEIARAQYSSGLLNYQDWDIIENDLIDSHRQRLTAYRDAAIAEAQWGFTLGASL